MGWSNDQIALLIISAGGTFSGAFVYSPSPGAGHLIDSIAAAAGTDPYGNAYLAGITNYNTASGQATQLLNGAVIMYGENPSFYFGGGSIQAGLDSIIIESPQLNSGDVPALIEIQSVASGGTPQIRLVGASAGIVQVLIGALTATTGAMLEVDPASGQAGLAITTVAALNDGINISESGDTNSRWKVRSDGTILWGSGSAAQDTQLNRASANLLQVVTADFRVHTAGRGLQVAEGSNAKQGTAALAAGTVVVSNTSVTASSRIFLTAQDNNSTGAMRVSARTAGTSFTITSSNAADTGVVAYEIFEPG